VNVKRVVKGSAVALGAVLVLGGARAESLREPRVLDPKLTLGPSTELNAEHGCIKCHEPHYRVWKETHHAQSLAMPRTALAKGIRRALRKRVKRFRPQNSRLCQSCHFTLVVEEGAIKPKYGVSCESCHGEGGRHVALHSNEKQDYGARMAKAEQAGLIRPTDLYGLARNCFDCHLLVKPVGRAKGEPTLEELVNLDVKVRGQKGLGHHSAGTPAFDLLAYSQGELRHNFNDGKQNPPSAYRRGLYVVGKLVDLELSLRALARVTQPKGRYAREIRARIEGRSGARAALADVARALGGHPLAASITQALSASQGPQLPQAADAVAAAARRHFSRVKPADLKALETALRPIEPLLPRQARGKVHSGK
jgi:hypothetical protein